MFSGYMGYGSYIGTNCNFWGKIGRYCSIANDVRTIIGTHPSKNFVSTHPCFYSLYCQGGFTYANEERFDEYKYAENKYNVVLGNDVWIGYGARIMAGVTIGDGSIIGAGAIVTKDVAPYTIVGGVPAKVIRKRFEDEDIEFLLKLKWWDWSVEKIKKYTPYFDDIKAFKIQIEKDMSEGEFNESL